MTKEVLRKLMKAKLSLIDENSFTEKSTLISKNLAFLNSSLKVIQDKISIGVFAPIAKEPLWYLGFSEEIEKLTAYPAKGTDNNVMTYRMARMSDLVIKKDFGFEILGPPLESPEVIPGVILIPGLVFTERGERLGRGKGFYDKYLSQYHGIKIGICFSEQLEDSVPTEKHDVTLDYIITDEKIINCKRAK
ncbi:MAG: 5-formyltetrahydrofolate cyclo-ligase [Bacteriovorax sp.]|nr:5-formyltetrahydrofolate cyclo-ligase [Bacteriovorax sp.]